MDNFSSRLKKKPSLSKVWWRNLVANRQARNVHSLLYYHKGTIAAGMQPPNWPRQDILIKYCLPSCKVRRVELWKNNIFTFYIQKDTSETNECKTLRQYNTGRQWSRDRKYGPWWCGCHFVIKLSSLLNSQRSDTWNKKTSYHVTGLCSGSTVLTDHHAFRLFDHYSFQTTTTTTTTISSPG